MFSTRGAPGSFKGWLDKTGNLALLIGLPVSGHSTQIEGAQKLVEAFAADGSEHFSSLQRTSVV